jgi:DNA-binding XRE family transcriptional regulator
MEKIIKTEAVKEALTALGWSQKQLATELGVSAQAVTNWLKGTDYPRPAALLKLATTLHLTFDQLVASAVTPPVIAFRKKGNAKTTEHHICKAMAMGSLLRGLVPFLPPLNTIRSQIAAPETSYEVVQAAASELRKKIGVGQEVILQYEHLISDFDENGAVIVPVMWGQKRQHENAIHIYLPDERVTFIYLNLDTYIEDFKFWMAHELAHVYSQELAGKELGEDFADALAGALLYPREISRFTYREAALAYTKAQELEILIRAAEQHQISLYSVFCEVKRYAEFTTSSPLRVADQDIHAVRNVIRGPLVSEMLFKPQPPEASTYIASAKSIFQSEFFNSLRRMIKETGTGPGYIQQVLNVPLKDATAIHSELTH